MKSFFTFILVTANVLFAAAQWSNTTNQFTDNMHMPVCTEVGDQTNAIAINSYPDGGYFFVWEDKRGGFYNVTQIFAQKYDKDGNRLWAQGGIPISSSTNEQKYSNTGGPADFRTYSYGASDGAGGLYLTYTDDSVSTYSWKRIIVQHLQPNGTRVFSGAGYIVAQPIAGESYNFSAPQLISDDEGGFYVSYSKNSADNYIYVYCYKDNGGNMTLRGGGLVNENGVQQKTGIGCLGAYKYYIDRPVTNVTGYHIWSDLQGGCSVMMSMSGNAAGQGKMLCYNRVWKAKKNSTVSAASQYPTGDPRTFTIDYAKGDIDVLYKFTHVLLNQHCTNPDVGVLLWVDDDLVSQGYLVIDAGAYDYNFPKGITVSTTGNVNVEMLAFSKRTYDAATNTVSPYIILGIASTVEKYDSVPYQRASFTDPTTGYNYIAPASINTLDNFRDTLLAPSIYSYDFSLAGGANQIYAAALINDPGQDFRERAVRLQHLSAERQSATNFSIQYKTGSHKGTKIGSEIYTGFQDNSISYEFPLLTANTTGNALLYIREYGRYTRVSPVLNGAELAWGAMGKPIGTPGISGGYFMPELPFASIDPVNGTGVIAWRDSRNFIPPSGTNIFMRHLDNLNAADYLPGNKTVQALTSGAYYANPVLLTGSSKKFSTIESFNSTTGTTSPVVEILDNYNLGAVPVSVYEHTQAIRTTNGKPYLNRNYTITPQNNPNGSASINVRLFFTSAQFDALKTADPTIADPSSLSVIKQTNAGGSAPATYTALGGETEIAPVNWQAVDGGYYLEIAVTGFSNFFIQKTSAALPVKWLGVQAQWADTKNAKISWQVSEQQNVKDYTVQQSDDGIGFKNVCTTIATSFNNYSCTVPAKNNSINYYRVLQTDIDNKYTYSKTVTLRSSAAISLAIHPNPAKDRLYIDGAAGYNTLQVSDISGKIIQQHNALAGLKSIDISLLKPGLYLLTASGDKGFQTLKFAKQ